MRRDHTGSEGIRQRDQSVYIDLHLLFLLRKRCVEEVLKHPVTAVYRGNQALYRFSRREIRGENGNLDLGLFPQRLRKPIQFFFRTGYQDQVRALRGQCARECLA